MTNEMEQGAVDMNMPGGTEDMPEADERDVMEGEEGLVGVETPFMPGEAPDAAAEIPLMPIDEMNGSSDPMNGRQMSMSMATGRHPIELAGDWKLTLSIS